MIAVQYTNMLFLFMPHLPSSTRVSEGKTLPFHLCIPKAPCTVLGVYNRCPVTFCRMDELKVSKQGLIWRTVFWRVCPLAGWTEGGEVGIGIPIPQFNGFELWPVARPGTCSETQGYVGSPLYSGCTSLSSWSQVFLSCPVSQLCITTFPAWKRPSGEFMKWPETLCSL